jgi:hypothetical protein
MVGARAIVLLGSDDRKIERQQADESSDPRVDDRPAEL